MNCNPCCGCFPPITTYNPSAADNFPTILQQVEYLKALLKKYPSQQFFVSTDVVTKDTIKITTIKNDDNRQINAGDFIFAHTQAVGTIPGDILMFSYTGAKDVNGNYIVDYVGTFGASNEDIHAIRSKVEQIATDVNTANETAVNAQSAATEADTKAQNALDLATTNETDIGTLDGQVAQIETNLNNKQDKITNQTELTTRSLTTVKDVICENNLKGRYLFCSHTSMGSPSNSAFLIFEYGQSGIVKSKMRFQTFANMGKEITVNFPNEDGTVVYSKNLKTIFGNQSLVGAGNIDLYKHKIAYTNTNGDIFGYSTFYSSKNLQCDSLTDLKTVLGDNFNIAVYPGSGHLINNWIPLSLDNSHMIILDITNGTITTNIISYDAFTITDDVKTI